MDWAGLYLRSFGLIQSGFRIPLGSLETHLQCLTAERQAAFGASRDARRRCVATSRRSSVRDEAAVTVPAHAAKSVTVLEKRRPLAQHTTTTATKGTAHTFQASLNDRMISPVSWPLV